jgi:hypothetical protein
MWTEDAQLVCEVSDQRRARSAGGRRSFAESNALGRRLLVVNQAVGLLHTRTTPMGTTTRIHVRLT